MSNALAIATVTASLVRVAEDFVSISKSGSVPGARVTTHDPRSESLRGGDPIVNVFLYRVTPNSALDNQGTPFGGAAPSPRLAVNLDYLISFFGDDAKLEPQRLLGSVVAGLHAQPILTSALIAQAVAEAAWLTGSDLAQSDEPVRFTFVPISPDELQRLTGTGLLPVSVAYRASGLKLD